MRFWDRLKWCVIGGAGYALGRYLFQLVQTYTGGYEIASAWPAKLAMLVTQRREPPACQDCPQGHSA